MANYGCYVSGYVDELTNIEKLMAESAENSVLVNQNTVYGCYVSGHVDVWFDSEQDAHVYCSETDGVEFNDRPVYMTCKPGELVVGSSERVFFSYERTKFMNCVACMSDIPTEWVIPNLGKPAVSAA